MYFSHTYLDCHCTFSGIGITHQKSEFKCKHLTQMLQTSILSNDYIFIWNDSFSLAFWLSHPFMICGHLILFITQF